MTGWNPFVPVAAGAAALGAAAAAGAQALEPDPRSSPQRDTVVVAPEPGYAAGPFRRFFNGDNRRAEWTRSVSVPVLALDTFAGGLVPVEQGGNQSRTLHLESADGREFIFRSTDKFPVQVLPEDLVGTPFQALLKDHVSIFHPFAGLVVPRLNAALGLLAVPGVLRVMPDDPRLGRFRDAFAGMLGLLVERPNEGEGGTPGWRGYSRIVGTERLLELLEETPNDRVDAREYLASRLVDFLVNDTDRGGDQWRWAREPAAWGARWRPIARDRDWALMSADGVLARLVDAEFFPKLAVWKNEFHSIEGLLWHDRELSQRLLAGLDRAAWEAVTASVQAGLTDDVLRGALEGLPPEVPREQADTLLHVLAWRRDHLQDVSARFYRALAGAARIDATDAPEHAELLRRDGGALEVTLYHGAVPWYHRVFVPAETHEVLLDLHGGDDVAVVRGTGAERIAVRVVAGGGADTLYDAGSGGPTYLYAAGGQDVVVAGPRTSVDRRPYGPPAASTSSWFAKETGNDRVRHSGSSVAWFTPEADYRAAEGVVVGGGPTWTTYGFRRDPFASRFTLRLLYGMGSGDFGARADAVWHLENSPAFGRLRAEATELQATRFYGYGNSSEAPASAGSGIVRQDRMEIQATLGVETPSVEAYIGPTARYTLSDGGSAAPAVRLDPVPRALTEVGVRSRLSFRRVDNPAVPTHGFSVAVDADAYPAAAPRFGPHASADVAATAYLPLPIALDDGASPVLAVRGGASRAWGDFPFHAAARLGGRLTVRGYRWERFAGEAATWAGAELRIPLFRADLWLTKGRLGVIGLADAGRVYVDGASPGGWHLGRGAGVYFETLGTAVSAVWARGEEDRVYLGLGMPF